MSSSWRLLIYLCSLLFITYLSCATGDTELHSSEDVADVDGFYADEKALLSRNRAGRQQRSSTDDAPTRGAVHRVTLTGRRERSQSRRRKKLENASRRGRGGGGRGWRRRGNFHESTSSIATTASTTIDQQTSATSGQQVNTHAVDFVTRSSEITEVTGVTEDRVVNGDVLMETISDNGDDMMILLPHNTTMIKFSDISQRVNACRMTQCPRHKVCLLNIQGLPMCRCPSVYHCRGLERRPVCTVDGRSYRNKCFLRVDECAANRRMRVLHRGPCRVTAGRRVFDANPDVTSQRRQRQRQRDVVSTERRLPTEYHPHRRRGRIRRRRPRHNPVMH